MAKIVVVKYGLHAYNVTVIIYYGTKIMSFGDKQIPPPGNWEAFEALCTHLFSEIYGDKHAERYGRQGQRQNGVDILVHNDGKLIGIQCKEKQNWPPTELTIDEIKEELEKVAKFPHSLSEYIIATTAPADTKNQIYIENIRAQNQLQGKYPVYIWDWGKIVLELNKYRSLQITHYAHFFLTKEELEALKRQQKPAIEKMDFIAQQQLSLITQQRWFAEFDKTETLSLGNSIIDGDFSYCSPLTKSKVLNSLIPIIAFFSNDSAQKYLDHLLMLTPDFDTKVARAFILAGQKKIDEAFSLLPVKDSNAYLSEACIIQALTSKSSLVAWLNEKNKKFDDLNSDAKVIYLLFATYDDVVTHIFEISQSDILQQPILMYQKALLLLASTVALEYRQNISHGNLSVFYGIPLGANSNERSKLAEAYNLFVKFSEKSHELNKLKTANISADFALLIKLKQTKSRSEAIQELQQSMNAPDVALRRLNMAIIFNLPVDIEAIKKIIPEKLDDCNEVGPEISLALFFIGSSISKADEALKYFEEHYDKIVKNIEITSVEFAIIKRMCLCGKRVEARKRAEGLQNLDDDKKMMFNLILSENITPESQASTFFSLYEKTPTIDNLMRLCDVYAQNKDSENLSKYSEILFNQTHSLESFAFWVKSLNNLKLYTKLDEILSQNSDLLNESEELQEMWVWSLLRQGNLVEAQKSLDVLVKQSPNNDYTQIQQSLAIASGDNGKLYELVNKIWTNREKFTSERLLQIAKIAQSIKHEKTKDICDYVVEKEPCNPSILLSAYMISVAGGWENDCEKASSWLSEAVKYSGDDGPIKLIDIKDLAEKSNWVDHSVDIYEKFKASECPIFVVAEQLNQPWINMFFLQGIFNERQNDCRKKVPIYAFSGSRIATQCKKSMKISLDGSSLLSVYRLGLLDAVTSAFSVTIPSSTMGWLFDDLSSMQFHQPSQVNNAKNITSLLPLHKLNEFRCNVNLSSELLQSAGYDFAAFIAMAIDGNSKIPDTHFVIYSNPVYKVSSFCQERIDVSPYKDFLRSAIVLVKKLNNEGSLTESDYIASLKYLNQRNVGWEDEDIIPDGATVYIDNVSIGYLLHINLLQKITDLNLNIYVLPVQYTSLLALDELKKETRTELEKLHSLMTRKIANGSIKVAPLPDIQKNGDEDILLNPISGILSISNVAAAVVDDRYSNQFPHISNDNNSSSIPILSSYDLLDCLHSLGKITSNDVYKSRTKLRRMGYIFIPVSTDEISYYLSKVQIKNDEIIESAELRAIRENYFLAQASEAIALPKESPWLNNFARTIVEVIRKQWSSTNDIFRNKVISLWLLRFLDLRGWCHGSFGNESAQIAQFAYLPSLQLFLVLGKTSGINNDYENWVGETVIPFLIRQEPLAYKEIVSWLKDMSAALINKMKAKETRENSNDLFFSCILKNYIRVITNEFYRDHEFCKKFEIQIKTTLSIGAQSFIEGVLFNAIRQIAGKNSTSVIVNDVFGTSWSISWSSKNYGEIVLSCNEKEQIILKNQVMFLPEVSERIKQCSDLAREYNVDFTKWHGLLSASSLDDDLIYNFQIDIRLTPYAYIEHLSPILTYEDFVPRGAIYFERLIGQYANIQNQDEYLKITLKMHISNLLQWNKKLGLKIALMISATSAITNLIDISSYSDDELLEIGEEIANSPLLTAKVSLYELMVSHFKHFNEEIETILQKLIFDITEKNTDDIVSEYNLFSGLFVSIYNSLSETMVLSEAPVFYKRLAAFTQASLVRFVIGENANSIYSYTEVIANEQGRRYQIQSICEADFESVFLPSFIAPDLLQGAFACRLYESALKNKDVVTKSSIVCNTLGWDINVEASWVYPRNHEIFTPDILSQKSKYAIPAEYREMIKTKFSGVNISFQSFNPLLFSSLIFIIDEECINWTIAALSRIDAPANEEVVSGWACSLAWIAAINNSPRLLQEIFNTIDRLKIQVQNFSISVENQFYIVLIGVFGFANKHESSEILRSKLMVMAHSEISSQDAETLRSCIRIICSVNPLLWKSLGAVDAILAMKK